MGWNSLYRSIVLSVAGHTAAVRLARRYGMRLGASRFVAGEQRDEALAAVRRMNREGLAATLDYLGESVRDADGARQAAAEIRAVLAAIAHKGLKANVSLKPTQLGLGYDNALCRGLMRDIVGDAARLGLFVRLDMEDSPHTDATLSMTAELAREYGDKAVGTVLQAYLYRSEADLAALGPVNIRIVKGAYREPPSIAYPRKRDVDANYVQLVRSLLEGGGYAAVATHDEAIVNQICRWAREKGIDRRRFEFQMLYGIAGPLARRLAARGYTVRIYTPYGASWYPYFTRRIAERPANLLFVAKGIWRRRT